MRLSLVIPVKDEAESLPELFRQIRSALEPTFFNAYEILVVDDGSRDATWKVLKELSAEYPMLKAWRFQSNLGKSAALTQAFAHCRGADVVTLDGDLQDDPNEIPAMLSLLDDGYHLVSGWKQKRHDPWHKTIPSRFFNHVVSVVAGQRLHDFNCGLKAYRSDVVRNLEIYGDYHRFIPLKASWMGFKITEKVVQHRPRVYGVSKYGWSRLISGFLDLVSLLFLHWFGRKPFHFFGTVGLLSSAIGASIMLWFFGIWVLSGSLHVRPLMVLGITALLAGFQFICLGLLGEMLNHRTQPKHFPILDQIQDEEAKL